MATATKTPPRAAPGGTAPSRRSPRRLAGAAPAVASTPDSPLGETGLRGDAAGLLDEGVARFTTAHGVFVYDEQRGRRWYHEAALRVPVCDGADSLRGSLTLTGVQEFRTADGGTVEVQLSGVGEPVPSSPGGGSDAYDVALRIGVFVLERRPDGTEARESGSAELALSEVAAEPEGLLDAAAAVIEAGGLRVDTSSDRVLETAAAQTATLLAFASGVGPGFARARLAAADGEGCDA